MSHDALEIVEIHKSIIPLEFVFKKPPIFEIFGGGFDKDNDCEFWVLRWPRVLKVHFERDYLEALTFDELQDMAIAAQATPTNQASEEDEWVAKLSKTHFANARQHNPLTPVKESGVPNATFWETDSPSEACFT